MNKFGVVLLMLFRKSLLAYVGRQRLVGTAGQNKKTTAAYEFTRGGREKLRIRRIT